MKRKENKPLLKPYMMGEEAEIDSNKIKKEDQGFVCC